MANPGSVKAPGKRKKKPKELAIITADCTGCAGSPACLEYCPVPSCMVYIDDPDTIFGVVIVDPALCIGCKKCTSKGPHGAFLDGCPWDAIDMVSTADFEEEHGDIDVEWDIPAAIAMS